jgi:UDP-galactopyranose mutase
MMMAITNYSEAQPDLICLCHIRWNFVYQRPQHLLTRGARDHRVFFIEEPIFVNGSMRMEVRECEEGIRVVVPYLPEGLHSEVATEAILQEMTRRLFLDNGIKEYVFWYYTPMALSFTSMFSPLAAVYDCMDELSVFNDAPLRLKDLEKELFERVDLVFTGGQSLYEAKRNQHHAVYAFPSSIDVSHFGKARIAKVEAKDQATIPHPRLGFFGVIDERLDVELLDSLATNRPDWNFVMIGPVVKIDPDSLPTHANIHYLGAKSYAELPDYLAGWDIALLLYARNESTRFISPTKTPEYLAAGKPVISTSIHDVVRPYGELGMVRIADSPADFIQAAQDVLANSQMRFHWLKRVDDFLSTMSWDQTWNQMSLLLNQVVAARRDTISAPSTNVAHIARQSAIAARTSI